MNFLQNVLRNYPERKGDPKVSFIPQRDGSEMAVVATMILADKAERLGVVISDDALYAYLEQLSDGLLDNDDFNRILSNSHE